ncbi:MAG: MarR family transcriptional regulator [Actinomycetota bacterium]|nr:MarR family transcriptional regulator [Actinomycetota bacterium]
MGRSDDRDNTTDKALRLRRSVGMSLRVLGSEIDRLDEAVAARMGLHRSDLRCLEIAARAGGVSAGELAERAGLSTSAVTSVVDRVERLGLVRRVRDATDRRRVWVEVTDLGRSRGWEAFQGLMEGTQAVLAGYSVGELAILERFVAEIRAVLVAEAAKAAGRLEDEGDGA